MPEDNEKKEYDVTATDMHGEASKSTEEAESVGSLVEGLRAGGWQVSSVTGRRGRRLFEPRRCDLEEFAFFNSELASACRRGAPLPGALRALSRDMSGRRVREALEGVASEVEGGTDLAEALSRRSDVFPPGYVALVEAGLKAGDLAGTLLFFAEEARLSAKVRHRFIGAVAYPLLVLFAGSGFLALAGWHIVPAFEGILEGVTWGARANLPWPTRAVLALAPLCRWSPLILTALVIAVPALWNLVARRASAARLFGELALTAPVAGRLVRAISMARFCRTLAGALGGRVPIPEAITLAGLASGNAAVQAAAEKLRRSVEEGSTVSDGLAEQRSIFPSAVVWMLHIAEKRGELVGALGECARLQEQRVERLSEVAPIFAAAAVTFMSGFIALGGVLAMFLPMIQLQLMLS